MPVNWLKFFQKYIKENKNKFDADIIVAFIRFLTLN
jgi:hypothetical protein